MSSSQTLQAMYDAMLARFGHQKWWPGDTAVEVCIGAILTQNTNWVNVSKAIANLKREGLLDIAALCTVGDERLAELIRPAGYFNVKTRRLKNFVKHVCERTGGDLQAFLGLSLSTLREELLSVNGIGRETADSIILYAARKATFVVDAYTYRILLRHRLIAMEDDYEAIKELMESSLPRELDLYNDYHAQLVMVGKTHCRPTAKCEGCPLEGFPHDRHAGTQQSED